MASLIFRDPIVTYFNSTSSSFTGFGLNLSLIDTGVSQNVSQNFASLCSSGNLSFQYARLIIGTQDPTLAALNNSTISSFDNTFATAPFTTDSNASSFFTEFKTFGARGIYSFIPPPSWLDANGYLTGELALNGFAEYILSGILFIRNYGNIAADMVELFPEPDLGTYGKISPNDLVILADRFQEAMQQRFTNESLGVNVVAPGLSCVLSPTQNNEPYTEAFINAQNAINYWSNEGNENPLDIATYNVDDNNARRLLGVELARNVTFFDSINPNLNRLITKMSSITSRFKKIATNTTDVADENGYITPQDPTTTSEYAIRNAENICSMLGNSVVGICYSNFELLFGSNGSPKPMAILLGNLMASLPPYPATTYYSEEINSSQDFTVKSLLTSSTGQSFTFVLCRPVDQDALDGKLSLQINNPLWNSEYVVSNLKITSFPQEAQVTSVTTVNAYGQNVTTNAVGPGVNLSNVQMYPSVTYGSAKLLVTGLPYGGCVLLISGNVVSRNENPSVPAPAPAPAPTPAPCPSPSLTGGHSPVVLQTIIQMPVNYGQPTLTTYPSGTVYFDSMDKVLKVLVDGNWIAATLLPYI